MNTPLNESNYLYTDQKYEDFELKLTARFITNDLKVDGGITFRTQRVPNSNEVMGYQADVGYIDDNAIPIFGVTSIKANGTDIELKINETTTAKYTERRSYSGSLL